MHGHLRPHLRCALFKRATASEDSWQPATFGVLRVRLKADAARQTALSYREIGLTLSECDTFQFLILRDLEQC